MSNNENQVQGAGSGEGEAGAGGDVSSLREAFEQALSMSAVERAAFLERLGDAGFRSRLEQMLLAAESDPTFLSAPTGDPTKTVGEGTRERRISPVFERPGIKIGLYKLLQVIGEGGFGTVFLAEQDKPVRRRVALKILKLGMDTKSIIARFEAERQALALMDHPHIARVLDAGATESGRPFFVMEYVVGDAITRFADAHKLGVQARLELFQQVCQAVQHAHTKGVIHRDLKPGNVLVSMSDGKPFAKVIDFGIAKATSQPLTDKTLFTEHRQLLGTPEYMSPEQAEGSADIDTRTDVYALGVLLYELLTGATPFDAKRLRSAVYAEMQRIIKEEEPPLPSVRLKRDLTTLAETAAARQLEPAKLNSLIKGELDWIVMKSLDKDRARRYETASALAADVQRHLAGEAVVAAPPSTGYRVRKFVRRNKGPVIAGGAVAAALLVGLAGTTWQRRQAQFAAERAEALNSKMQSVVHRAFASLQYVTQSASKADTSTQGTTAFGYPLDSGQAIVVRFSSESPNAFEYCVYPQATDDPNVSINGPMNWRTWQLGETLTEDRFDDAQALIQGLGKFAVQIDEQRRAKALETAAANQQLQAANKSLSEQASVTLEAIESLVDATFEVPVGGFREESATMPSGDRLSVVRARDESGRSTVRIFRESGKRVDINEVLSSPQEPISTSEASIALANVVRSAVATYQHQSDAAEWGAYTANIALAQASMQANNWPEARKRLEACPENKRGWEWTFLKKQANSVAFTVKGEFPNAAFSPDGRYLAVSANGERAGAILWSLPLDQGDSRPVALPDASKAIYVRRLGFSFGSERLFGIVMGDAPGLEMLTWDVATLQLNSRVSTDWRPNDLADMVVVGEEVTALVRNNDRNTRTWSSDGTHWYTVWRSSGGRPFERLWETEMRGLYAKISPDGRMVSGWPSDYEAAATWLSTTGERVLSPEGSLTWSRFPSFSPDATYFLYGGGKTTLTLLSNDTKNFGAIIGEVALPGARLEGSDFSANGKRIILSHPFEDSFAVWDRETRRVAFLLNRRTKWLSDDGIAFSADGSLAWVDDSDAIGPPFVGRLSEAPTYNMELRHRVNDDPVRGRMASVYTDVSSLWLAQLSSSAGGFAADFSASTPAGAPLDDVRAHFGLQVQRDHEREADRTAVRVGSAVLSPDRKRLFTVDTSATLRVFDASSSRQLMATTASDTQPSHHEVNTSIRRVHMTADGTRLILMHADGSARIWDIRDPAERLKDREREWAEQPEADKYVDALLAGPRPTADLDAFLRADESLTPLRRLVAWRTLRDRLADLERESSDRYAAAAKLAEERQVKDKRGFVELLEAELASGKDLSPRVSEKVLAMGATWEYREAKPSEAEQLAEEKKLRRLAEADRVAGLWGTDGQYGAPALPSVGEYRNALAIREELLGRSDARTLEMLEMLAKREEGSSKVDLFADLVKRTAEIQERPTGILISRYAMYASAAALDHQYARAETALDFVRAHVNELDPEDYLSFAETFFANGQVGPDVRRVRDNLLQEIASLRGQALVERVHAEWLMKARHAYSATSLMQGLDSRSDNDREHILSRRYAASEALEAKPDSIPALRQLLICQLRLDEFGAALESAQRLETIEHKSCFSRAAVAMVRWRLAAPTDLLPAAQFQIDGRVLSSDEHRNLARAALSAARELAKKLVLGSDGRGFVLEDEVAMKLLQEAIGLIEGDAEGALIAPPK